MALFVEDFELLDECLFGAVRDGGSCMCENGGPGEGGGVEWGGGDGVGPS